MSGSAPGGQPSKGQSKAQKIQQLGKYKLVARLGQGGMGAVYKAIDTQLEREVALKILSPSRVSNEKYVHRFLREARSAAALSHPNIVGALDVGQEANYYYFTMEFVDGITVRDRLKAQGPLPEAEAVSVALQVAQGLQHAASKNIIHRDVKPENIMISKEGEVKLTDMGLAKATDTSEATITQAGAMIGTPQYASPEQVRGETTIDSRTDIYSLGMTLYHMIVGHPPFDGETAAVVNAKHLNEPLPDVKAVRPELSDGLCRVLQKMCEKEPDKRYQSADELIEDLELVKAGQAPKHVGTALPTHLQRRQTGRRGAARRTSGMGAGAMAAIMGAVIVGAALIFFMVRKGDNGSGKGGPGRKTTIRLTGKSNAPLIEEGPQQDARTALAEARRFAQANPQELGAVVNLYSSVLEFKDTREAEVARTEIKKISDEVSMAFVEKEKEVLGYMARGSLGDALMAIDMFPERYQFGAWDQKYVALKERCQWSIETALGEVTDTAAEAVGKDDFRRARQLYTEALAQFPAIYARDLEDKLAELEEREREYEERVAVLRMKFYREFRKENEALFKSRNYDGLLKAAAQALADPERAAIKPEIEMEIAHAKLLSRLLELAEQGAKKRIGRSLSLKRLPARMTMTLKDVKDGKLDFVAQGGIETSLTIATHLAAQELLVFAKAGLAEAPERNVILGAFYFAEDEADTARDAWEKAEEEGQDVALALQKLKLIGLGEKELQARSALAKIRSSFRRKKWEDALRLIEEAESVYKETEAFSGAGDELAEIAEKSKLAMAEGGDEDADGRPSYRSGSSRDGLEARMDWVYLRWPSGTGTAVVSYDGLKGAEDPNRVMKFSFTGVVKGSADLPKIFVGRESLHDFSKGKRLGVRVHNPSDTRVKISLALCTGPGFEYFESPIEFDVKPGASSSWRCKLTAPNFKWKGSNWRWTARVRDLNQVRRVVFVVHPQNPDGELIFEFIGLTD